MRRSGKRVLSVLLALALVMMSAPAMAAIKEMKACQDAKVYAKPKTSSKVVIRMEMGEKVIVSATSGKWARVFIDGKCGYMSRKALVSLSKSLPEAVYATEKLALRKTASVSGKKLKTIPEGGKMLLSVSNKSWAKVKYSGKVGYVVKSGITREAPEPPEEEEEGYATLRSGSKGAKVLELQRRLKELDWFYGDLSGNYLTLTAQAVKDFQKAAGMSVTGVADPQTQEAVYSENAPRYVEDEDNIRPALGPSQMMDWYKSNINRLFKVKKVVIITDVRTGISWREKRVSGTTRSRHADCEPCTAADAAKLKRVYGGRWSWDRRPIWVSIDGKRYAASMNGMPHGKTLISANNFDGHHCIHFLNSRTDGKNRVDPAHQAAVREAYAADNH